MHKYQLIEWNSIGRYTDQRPHCLDGWYRTRDSGFEVDLATQQLRDLSSLSLLADKCNERENLVLKTTTTLFHFFCLGSDPDIVPNTNFCTNNALIMTTPNSLTQKNLRSSSLVLKGIHETINEFK